MNVEFCGQNFIKIIYLYKIIWYNIPEKANARRNLKIKKFDDWTEYTGASEGSGRSKKIWLTNTDTGEIGLFKFNKSEETKENISEKIATQIAELIGIRSANVEIGTYNNKIGCMSYNLLKENEELLEGINLINLKYPYYDPDKLYDIKKKEYYSLEMILNSLKEFKGLEEKFIEIIFFDYIIGNTDRHQNNWGVIKNNGDIREIAPIYDNGSSLCSYIKEEKIKDFLGKDKIRFESLVNTKSTSRIRINKYKKKEPTHLEVITYLKENKNQEFNKNLNRINERLNKKEVENIIDNIEEISEERKKLIKKYIWAKIKLINKV